MATIRPSGPMERTEIAPSALRRVTFGGSELRVPGRTQTRGSADRYMVEPPGAIRWRVTGLAVPADRLLLRDGTPAGGFEVIERTAFVASEGPRRAVPVMVDHDSRRLLGLGWLEWVPGSGWHARASVHTPPTPAGWSPKFLSYRPWTDADGVTHHHQCRLIELTLADPARTAWRERTRASVALETRSLFD